MFCFLFVLFAPFLCLLFYTLAARLLDPSPKTVSEVVLLLRPVSILELEDLFDEIKERNLRLAVPTPQFRDIHRTRSRLLLEYLRRMSFNTLMLLVWAYAEDQRTHGPGMHQDDTQSKHIREMIEFGTKSRSYCLLAVFHMAWRILLGRFRAAKGGGLATMRSIAGIDGLETYRQLARTAVGLSAGQGNHNTRDLAALLVGRELAN